MFTYNIKNYKIMNYLVEEGFDRAEQREPMMTVKELLIKLRKEHLNSISATIQSLRRDKYLTKNIDKKIALQSLISVLTDEYLEVEKKLNQVESE